MKPKKGMAIKSEQEAQYYKDAIDWDEEIYRKERKSKNHWRIAALAFAVIALFAVVAVAGLAPLKTAVPYVIKVDQTTGFVEVLKPLEDSQAITQEDAITKYFIVKFLNAREQYDIQRAEEDYEIVGKLSSEKVFNEYRQWFVPDNPESPLNVYGDKTTVEYHVRDVSLIDGDRAIIHIKRKVKNLTELRESYWVITLSYEWLAEPKSEADRFINPLGFQVTRYRKDPEIMEEIQIKQ